MLAVKKQIVISAVLSSAAAFMVFFAACASGSSGGSSGEGRSNLKTSEVVVRRVDSNQLIRLRIYLDGKSQGSLRVGETAIYKVRDGYHTIRVGFDDYQRGTEVAQFQSKNSTHIFSVTDTSIVLINEDSGVEDFGPPLPLSSVPAVAKRSDSTLIIDNSVRSAFDKITKSVKKRKRVAIVNVDGDNINEANFVLEELTLLSVNSPKNFFVIDRRVFDAFRGKNAIGLPSYENDFMLRALGSLVQADYVISGRIDGPGELRRLRVKALEVSSGALIGDAAEKL
ncbi:MAG: hypothetical protein LBC77_09085 [Spirochaetaceae bacterium]|jgi:hypothetical protein|nr:hypothetical protein [Spirochaetaceae bacterium]